MRLSSDASFVGLSIRPKSGRPAASVRFAASLPPSAEDRFASAAGALPRSESILMEQLASQRKEAMLQNAARVLNRDYYTPPKNAGNDPAAHRRQKAYRVTGWQVLKLLQQLEAERAKSALIPKGEGREVTFHDLFSHYGLFDAGAGKFVDGGTDLIKSVRDALGALKNENLVSFDASHQAKRDGVATTVLKLEPQGRFALENEFDMPKPVARPQDVNPRVLQLKAFFMTVQTVSGLQLLKAMRKLEDQRGAFSRFFQRRVPTETLQTYLSIDDAGALGKALKTLAQAGLVSINGDRSRWRLTDVARELLRYDHPLEASQFGKDDLDEVLGDYIHQYEMHQQRQADFLRKMERTVRKNATLLSDLKLQRDALETEAIALIDTDESRAADLSVQADTLAAQIAEHTAYLEERQSQLAVFRLKLAESAALMEEKLNALRLARETYEMTSDGKMLEQLMSTQDEPMLAALVKDIDLRYHASKVESGAAQAAVSAQLRERLDQGRRAQALEKLRARAAEGSQNAGAVDNPRQQSR